MNLKKRLKKTLIIGGILGGTILLIESPDLHRPRVKNIPCQILFQQSHLLVALHKNQELQRTN